jgi:periplasmic divalent cation tolerance protein
LYVPCGSEEEAAALARELLSERLIACGNIYPSRSLYIWDGALADDTEYVLFAKTTIFRAATAALRIEELHSYEVPCVVTLAPAAANLAYSRWVAGQVSTAPEVVVPAPNKEG